MVRYFKQYLVFTVLILIGLLVAMASGQGGSLVAGIPVFALLFVAFRGSKTRRMLL